MQSGAICHGIIISPEAKLDGVNWGSNDPSGRPPRIRPLLGTCTGRRPPLQYGVILRRPAPKDLCCGGIAILAAIGRPTTQILRFGQDDTI
jgi:hypothetical protein